MLYLELGDEPNASLIVRDIVPETKVVDGKIVLVKDGSLAWEAPIYHLS